MSKGTDALRAQLGLYRDAVNELGVEAGVIDGRLSTQQAARSVAGDELYLEVIRETQLRCKRLSEGYERLRAASTAVFAEIERSGVLKQLPRTVPAHCWGHSGRGRNAAIDELGDCLARDLRAGL